MSTDATNKTVRRWVVRLRACLIISFRDWMKQKCEECETVEPFQEMGLRVMACRVRSDGTQAKFFKKAKLQVSEKLGAFLVRSIFSDTPGSRIAAAIESDRIMTDLAMVRGTGTGSGAVGLMQAQMLSVGECSSWD